MTVITDNIRYSAAAGTTYVIENNGVAYIQSRRLSKLGFIRHAFSTRIGGVSRGIYESMNLNYQRGDDPAAVAENFRRFASALQTSADNMVYSMQTHTTNVIRVTGEDCGNGVTKPQRFVDVDGLVTDEPGVCLVTTYADCVPLYFADVRKKAIGLSHAGWRGTAGNIAGKTIEVMHEEFGTLANDVEVFIGPSICRDCYEIGGDVAEVFMDVYGEDTASELLTKKESEAGGWDGKYFLDLRRANAINVINAGVPEENISVTDICTCCNPWLLFSHRASGGKRGGMCAFLELI